MNSCNINQKEKENAKSMRGIGSLRLLSTTAGFEPAHVLRIGLVIQRLNHSAKSPHAEGEIRKYINSI